jgi:hypothetical protein
MAEAYTISYQAKSKLEEYGREAFSTDRLKSYMGMETDLLELLEMESRKAKGKYITEMELTLKEDSVKINLADTE